MDARKRVDPRGLGGTMIAGPPVDGPGSRSLGARANDSRFWDAHAASGYPAGYSGPTSCKFTIMKVTCTPTLNLTFS